MTSAVVVAQQKGEAEAARVQAGQQNGIEPGTTSSTQAQNEKIQSVRVETEGAVYDNGKVYLKGNPLETTDAIVCPNCCLPRLFYPPKGAGARPPPDPSQEYCKKHPPITMPGHDVHGNRFATDKNPKKKKTQQPNTNTPGSSPPSMTSTPPPSQSSNENSFPTVKCPNCPRYFVVTRVAQHLDRCLGISGRQSSRAKAPENDVNIAPPAQKPSLLKRALPNSGDDEEVVTKKKKPSVPKKLQNQKVAPPSKLKNGTTPDQAAAAETSETTTATGAAPNTTATNGARGTGKKKVTSTKHKAK